MKGQLALEARGVSKRYGDRQALVRVNLVVRPGDVHGLLGPNGAGKTTLMRIALGLVRPDEGTVHLLGQTQVSQTGSLPDGVAGFVETPSFYPYLSGRTNLALLARLDSCRDTRATGAVDRVLEQVELSGDANRAVGGYSAGMRQRLGIAAALLRLPQLLLLDEPSNTLDPAGARAIRSLTRRLADSGVAVLLSSHDMTEVEDVCSALTVMREGRVVFAGTLDELRTRAPRAGAMLRTSDDHAAVACALEHRAVRVLLAPTGDCLEVVAAEADLDSYVIALGRAGIAVRGLEPRTPSLEALFLQLTGEHASIPFAPWMPPSSVRRLSQDSR